MIHPNSHGEWPIHLLVANNKQLDYWLNKFIIEVRRYDGQPFPPNTLYNIFKDSAFSGSRRTLDGQMNILRSTRHGIQAKQAEPLTIDEEDQLWKGGYLGDSSKFYWTLCFTYVAFALP